MTFLVPFFIYTVNKLVQLVCCHVFMLSIQQVNKLIKYL
nr:MAG TPA: hypothetical protein [Inoviridae sp.]